QDGSVARCAKSGCGNVPTVIATVQLSPGGWIALDDANVYWTIEASGYLLMCPKGKCPTPPMPNLLNGSLTHPRGVVATATAIYYAESYTGYRIMRVAK